MYHNVEKDITDTHLNWLYTRDGNKIQYAEDSRIYTQIENEKWALATQS